MYPRSPVVGDATFLTAVALLSTEDQVSLHPRVVGRPVCFCTSVRVHGAIYNTAIQPGSSVVHHHICFNVFSSPPLAANSSSDGPLVLMYKNQLCERIFSCEIRKTALFMVPHLYSSNA